jgi:hypothetical protein
MFAWGGKKSTLHFIVMCLDFDLCLSFITKTTNFQKWFQVLFLRLGRRWNDLYSAEPLGSAVSLKTATEGLS